MFNFKKKTTQERIGDLSLYKSNLEKTLANRESSLKEIDSFSLDELNRILVDVYNQKERKDLSSAKSKVLKNLTNDIEYNKIWINETRKKIEKFSSK